MARNAPEVLRPSLIDRLIGKGRRPGEAYGGVGLYELRDSVARDLEWLLNTRVLSSELAHDFSEAGRSILTYGMPDYTSASWKSTNDRRAIAAKVKQVVKAFEPRLVPHTVSVEVLEPDEENEFKLRYRIEGHLKVEPISERVVFDTEADVFEGGFQVRGVG